MSERKTIQINPELFKMSNKKTQKKQPNSPKIELKSEFKTQKQKTLRKNVLKMIRENNKMLIKNYLIVRNRVINRQIQTQCLTKTLMNLLNFSLL